MVKMQMPGIMIEVPDNEVDFYKRAGYQIVKEEAPQVQQEEAPQAAESEGPAKRKK